MNRVFPPLSRLVADRRHLSLVAALLCALGVGLGLALPSEAAEGAEGAGPTFAFTKGSVEVGDTPTGPFAKAKRGRQVAAGKYVRTGAESRAELRFPDGSVVRMGPDSVLHVKSAAFDGASKEVKVESTLLGGKAWANVSKLVGSESRFQMETQNAVAGVRGTVFRVNIDKERASVVKVYNGAVAVSNSPFFAASSQGRSSEGPIRSDRKQIAAPFQQVSKREWEQIVKQMMEVRVSADGTMSKAAAFTSAQDLAEDAEWVRWNLSCDKGECDF